MLKASAKADALVVRAKTKRSVMIEQLLLLHGHLSRGDDLRKVLLDMSLVAFWSMARLGELTCAVYRGHLARDEGVRIADVQIANDRQSATVKIHFAKTATSGEIQTLLLTATNNILCPAKALIRLSFGGDDRRLPFWPYYLVRKDKPNQELLYQTPADGMEGHWPYLSLWPLLPGRRGDGKLAFGWNRPRK
jgi:hypothetical protein